MPSVFIPPPYRGPTRGESEVAVSASTVRECLQAVESRYPGFGELVFAADGGLPRYVKLFLNGEVLNSGDVVDLGRLPIPIWTPDKDGAPYIT